MNNLGIMNGESFFIKKLNYFPMSNQQSIYSRPYTVVASDDSLYNLSGIIADNLSASGGALLMPQMVGDLVNSIISPSTVAYDTGFTSSWVDDGHYIFNLCVCTISAIGAETLTYIQGYTDHKGIGLPDSFGHANVNPQMNHVITSIIETVVTTTMTPMGPSRNEKLVRFYDVISDDTIEGVYVQTPTTIMGQMATNRTVGNLSRNSLGSGTNPFSGMNMFGDIGQLPGMEQMPTMGGLNFILDEQDQTAQDDLNMILANTTNPLAKINSFKANSETSVTTNNMSGNFLTTILNKGVENAIAGDAIIESEPNFGGTNYHQNNLDPIIGNNRFLMVLAKASGYKHVPGHFTFANLLTLDPTTDDRVELFSLNKNVVHDFNNITPEIGDTWNGQSRTSMSAFNFFQTGLSLANKYGFGILRLYVNTLNGFTPQEVIAITNYKSVTTMDDLQLTVLLNRLKFDFFNNVVLSESLSGTIPIEVELFIDLYGDSKIRINYGMEGEVWLMASSVLNRHMLPTVSTDSDSLLETSRMFTNMIDNVTAAARINTNATTAPMIFTP